MPGVRMKPLHLATSLEALNKKVNVDTNASPDKLLKSIKAVIKQAELSDKEGDEENAYILFMRYFTVVQAIQKHEDYKKNKKYYTTCIDGKLTQKILLRAEVLSASLERRYGLLTNSNSEEKKANKTNDIKVLEKRTNVIKELEEKEVKKEVEALPKEILSDGFIGRDKLYSLTKERVSSFLVIDVRSKEEFDNSFMKVSTLINIPEEALNPGLTASKAGRELNADSRLLWARRHTYDYIIICDWSTETLPFPSPINVLIEAMTQWDPAKTYRASPLVLKGGFEIFALTYPMLISNPRWNRTVLKSKNILNSISSINSDVSQLNFSFPDLDEAFISTPSPTLIKPSPAYPEIGELSIPLFNRKLKPKITSPQNSFTREDSEDSLQNLITDSTSDSSSGTAMNNGMVSSAVSSNRSASNAFKSGDHRVPSISSSSPSDTDDEDRNSGEGTSDSHATGIIKTESVPKVPSRTLKPQDLIDGLNVKKKFLDDERIILEKSYKAEKDALERLREMEETRKNKDMAIDEDTQKKFAAKETKLKIDLEEKKLRMKAMEREYSDMHHKKEEVWDNLSHLMSDQLNINAYEPQVRNQHKEGKDALKEKEEKQKILLKDIEIMRKKRKEKEKEMEEMQKKREREEAKRCKEKEETEEQWRLLNDRNARNSGQNVSASGKKRPGETYTTKLRRSPRSSPVRGGSNIRRSHSALNLSQLRDEDGFDFDSPNALPNFDRSLKPLNTPRSRNVNAARHRNFEAKYGSVPPTKTGLKNLGNTCYMNSIIQCLSNTVLLAKYFFDGLYSEDLNPKSNQKGEVAEEFGAVVRALWCSQYRSISMWDLKSVVGRHHKPFQGCDQHDSHEFLIKFMDWLHDDLNLVSLKFPKMEEQDFDENIPDRVAAQSVIDGLHERDESVVRDIFYGLHRSVITCHTCNSRSLTFEPFSILTVSFPVNGRCTLKDMFYDYYKETRIEYKCSKCRRMRNCSRKLDIWKLPPVLIIHLNRFEHDVLMKKKQNFVDFPLENLNLSEYTSGPSSYNNYDLYGVSNHYGTIDGGHYTAFCKAPQKTWYKFDDHEVYDLPRESVRTSAAYILFYEATSLKSSF